MRQKWDPQQNNFLGVGTSVQKHASGGTHAKDACSISMGPCMYVCILA